MEQTIRKVLKALFLHSLLASDQDFSSLNFGYDVSYYSTSSSAIFVLSNKKKKNQCKKCYTFKFIIDLLYL